MKEAPPIIGPLEFAGMENNIILVEHDEEDCSLTLLASAISDKINIIFEAQQIKRPSGFGYSAVAFIDSIAKISKAVKSMYVTVDFLVINRIDLMDLNFSKKEKGSQTKAYVSMMCSKKTLKGANLIITSAKSEYSLREIADTYISLRK